MGRVQAGYLREGAGVIGATRVRADVGGKIGAA